MNKILLSFLAFFFIADGFAQELVEKKGKIINNVTEVYHVLKNNEQIRQGLYQALYKRKTAVASGSYTGGKKTGNWYFYTNDGKIAQTYNYDKDSIKYEAREDTTSPIRYLIDKEITSKDRVTKPIKVGGRYFGYLPYLSFYKTPFEAAIYDIDDCYGVIELLISPMGRLAQYRVRVASGYLDFDQTIKFDVNLFKEEDKKFIPATFNGEAVLSRIIIACKVNNSGGLDFVR
ncbi:MAG TPA: hypothetical protein VK668_23240 [Mucilaginibacter sp.]|nr:hypothetical protein [Mucilaginibacter sp.]